MSYAHGTPFLNLAQTVGSDHRDWFDENEAKLNLDTKMKTLWDERASTSEILAALQQSVASLDTDVTSLSGIVSGHTTTIATINESLVLINTALQALNTQITGKFDSVGIADPYDATHGIYAVGDVVTYNGQRYVCITAVTAAEPFDVSKWRAEDVQTVFDSINADLTANNNHFTASYQNGTYGFVINGVFYPLGGGGSSMLLDYTTKQDLVAGTSITTTKNGMCVYHYYASDASTSTDVSIDGESIRPSAGAGSGTTSVVLEVPFKAGAIVLGSGTNLATSGRGAYIVYEAD